MIEIIALEDRHRPEWLPLWRGYQQFYEVEIDEETTDLTWRRLLDPSEPMFVLGAFMEGCLVGIVHFVFHRSTWTKGDYGYLQDLFTASEARGSGVGRALIAAVCDRATAQGASRVYWLTIYLVDSGLTQTQQSLGSVFSIYPLRPRSRDEDGAGHGSQMFEMIRNGDFGLAPGARVYSLKATSNVLLGGGGIDTVIDALRFLRDRSTVQGGIYEPGIVNLSLGQKVSPASTTSSSMELVLNDLRNDGFVIVAAAGNEGTNIVDQATGFKVVPAAVAGTVTVAGLSVATPGVDTRWVENPCLGVDTCGSNFGPEVSLFAPATNQPTLEPNGNFTNLKGTSGSTAYVSAVLATIGDFRPNLGLGQRFAFLQSRWTASGVADARSANTGILMSDLGYVRKALPAALDFFQETRVCPGQAATTNAPKTVSATIRADRAGSGLGAAFIVASSSFRNSGCPGNVPLNTGPVDLVVEAFHPITGARLWRSQFADPDGSNISIADNIGAVLDWTSTIPLIAVLVNTSEPARFAAINRTHQAGAGLDTYLVLLSANTGAVDRVIRYGGPGNDVGRALAAVGQDLAVVGTSDIRFNGGPVTGGSDAFAYAIGKDFEVTAPVKFIPRVGSERVEAVANVPGAPGRDILLVGGASVSQPSACSGASVDTLAVRLTVQPRTSGPGTGGIAIVSNQTFESPTSIVPAIQLDDWADSIAAVDSNTAVLGVQSRQFDCAAGGSFYFGPSSVQLLKYNFTTNQVAWVQSRGLQNVTGKANAFLVGSSGVSENYHLIAMGSAWKFDLSGTEVFSETVPAGPIAAFAGDFNAWFGDASGAESRDIR